MSVTHDESMEHMTTMDLLSSTRKRLDTVAHYTPRTQPTLRIRMAAVEALDHVTQAQQIVADILALEGYGYERPPAKS